MKKKVLLSTVMVFLVLISLAQSYEGTIQYLTKELFSTIRKNRLQLFVIIVIQPRLWKMRL